MLELKEKKESSKFKTGVYFFVTIGIVLSFLLIIRSGNNTNYSFRKNKLNMNAEVQVNHQVVSLIQSDPYFLTNVNTVANTCSSIITTGWHVNCLFCVSEVSTVASIVKPVAIQLSADESKLFIQQSSNMISSMDIATNTIVPFFTCKY